MVGEPFETKEFGEIRYSVGNPMGAYSSWNSFAVAHHYVVFHCCTELGIDWRTSRYVMLGDDLLIGDRALAAKYMEVIQSLGLGVSPLKSHASKTLCEFAKRLIYKGQEITPFPISSLKEVSKKYYLMVTLLYELSRQGWEWSPGIPASISLYSGWVTGLNSSFRKKILLKSETAQIMMQIMKGIIPANLGLNTLVGKYNIPAPQFGEYEGKSIISHVAMALFADDDPFNYKKERKEPLGNLAASLVMEMTNTEDIEVLMWSADAVSMVPVLNVHGQVEELYKAAEKEALMIDTVGKGDWPEYLRTLALPKTDRVYVERRKDTFSRVSAIFAQRVIETLQMYYPS